MAGGRSIQSHSETEQPITSTSNNDPLKASEEHAALTPNLPDESFFRFYSTFENLISTLSAPLAFAGLPLRPAEVRKADIADRVRPIDPTSASRRPAPPTLEHSSMMSLGPNAGLDLKGLFSGAALPAVKGDSTNHPVAE